MRKPRFHKTRLTAVLLFLAVLLALHQAFFWDKIYPHVFVSGSDIGFLTKGEAIKFLEANARPLEKITLTSNSKDYDLNLSDINLKFDYENSVDRAYKYTRTGNFFYDLSNKFRLVFSKTQIGSSLEYDSEKLDKFISVIAGQESIEEIRPSAKISGGEVVVNAGNPGVEVDLVQLKALIIDSISSLGPQKISIPVKSTGRIMSQADIDNYESRAGRLLGKNLVLTFEYQTFTYKGNELLSFVFPFGGWDEEKSSLVIEKIIPEVERPPQNPRFSFDGGRVTEFEPATDGVKLDKLALQSKLIESLEALENSQEKTVSIEIPVVRTKPDVATGEVNTLGINELIGRGYSTYYHSIPSRVHNVNLASSRINGILVKPDEEFSFNKALGDISQFTGYQQAYIIQDGKTVLGDGGGVCQVSSTLFRALLDAGLPITQRQAHAYRVAYYEQGSAPGFDATVYDPSPDLRFKNDTGKHILIVAKAEPKKYALTFELYGTSDGRIASTTKPVISNVTPPPDDLYQDDPTLPVGKIKQIDYKAWGARVVFNYSVSRNGEEIYKKTFVSNYRPWRAVYLRGTGPVN